MKQPTPPPAKLRIPFRQRTVVNVFVPFKAERPFERQPNKQQQRVGMFEMKVRRIQNARVAAFGQQGPKRSQAAVGHETLRRIFWRRASVSPNSHLVSQSRDQRLHVSCYSPVRRRHWSKE